MTPVELDGHVREILKAEQIVAAEALEEAETILVRMCDLGLKKDLLDVLVHRKFLAPIEAKQVRQRARYSNQQETDRQFARMVTSSNVVSQESIDEVLGVQEALFNAKQEIRPLSEILLARKLISAEEHAWAGKAIAGDEIGLAKDPVVTPVKLEKKPDQPARKEKKAERKEKKAEKAEKAEKKRPRTKKLKPVLDEAPAPPPSKLDAGTAPPPSKLATMTDAAVKEKGTGTKRLPAASPSKRRSRTLPSMRMVVLGLLVVGGFALTAGLFTFVRWMEQSKVDAQYSSAQQLLAKEKFLDAEAAFRKFLEDHPKNKRHPEAVLELQKLLINRAEVRAKSGMVEAAIDHYREVRLLDATTEPAKQATEELARLAGLLQQKKQRDDWQAFEKQVRDRFSAGAYQEALRLLGGASTAKLSASNKATLRALRLEAQRHLQQQILKKFVHLPAGKIKLPEGPPSGPSQFVRPVKRYRLRDEQPVYSGPGVGGTLLVPIGRMLHGVEARSGRVLWERSMGRGRTFAAVRLQGGMDISAEGDQLAPLALVVHPGRRSIALIEARTGKPRWERFLDSPISCRPAVYPPNVFVGTEGGAVYQLELDSGRLRGAFSTGGEIVASPSYDPTSDMIFLPASDGFLYVYELEQRRFLGRFATQPHADVPPIVLHPFVFLPQRLGGRTQLVVHQLVKQDKRLTLRRREAYDLEGHIRTPAAVLGGRVYCATDAGVLAVYAVDPGGGGKVYSLTKARSGRGVSMSGQIQLRPVALGRQILLSGTDLQLFNLPELKRGASAGYNITLAWSYESNLEQGILLYGQTSQPIEQAGQTVFLVSSDNQTHGVNLYAFDLSRKRVIWHRTLGSAVTGAPLRLQDPGPSDGRLVLLTQDGGLHCVCFDKGELVYRRMARGAEHLVGGQVARVDAQNLLVARGRVLRRVDAITAEAAPDFRLGFALKSDISCGPTVADGVAYFGTRGGALYAVDARTGASRHDLFTASSGKAFTTRPLVIGKTIVVGNLDRTLYGLTIKRIGGRSFLSEAWSVVTGGAIHSTPLLVGKLLFAASDQGKLYRIDPETGALRGSLQLPAAIRGPLAVGGGKLYCGTEDFHVNAIDLATLKLVWRTKVSGKLRATPVFSDGLLYVALTTGRVLALGKDGKPSWELRLPDRFNGGALTLRGKALYLGSQSGYLYEIER